MKKIKWLNYINIVCMGLLCTLFLILCIIFKWDVRAYYAGALCLAAEGIINLVFIALKEAMVLSYDSKKFIPILYVVHTVIGVLGYYLVQYLKEYDTYFYLYWLLLVLGTVLPIAVVIPLSRKKQANTKGPKVMINKNR